MELRMHVHGRKERCIQSVMGKCEGKRLLVRLSCRWEGNMDLEEIGWEVVDWNRLAEDVCKW
jgi:hypothetical protein